MSKNYLAYSLLVFATLCWSGNFIVGKFAYLFEVPPLTLNFLRWVSVWIILIPFTYKEIFNNFNYIKKNSDNIYLEDSSIVNNQSLQILQTIDHTKLFSSLNPFDFGKISYLHSQNDILAAGGVVKSLSVSLGVPFSENSVEKFYLEYQPKIKKYTPDFYLSKQDIYIETKGFFDFADRQKHLLVKEQNPDIDIRFLFVNANNKLNKSSKTTYGAWCDKHKILWAEKRIPNEWLK